MISHRRSEQFWKQKTVSFKLVKNYYGEKTYLKQMYKIKELQQSRIKSFVI